ncbi:MAG: GNAT family N-acetyltransferase [Gemmatimonadota bacterium]|nr:GNAT family N-acetyltransferase [Gemmatimonadota bacterium]
MTFGHIDRRAATRDDEDFMRRLHHSAYRHVVEQQFGAWNESQQDSFFADSFSVHPHEIILADGEPVGYCAIEEREDDIHLRELVVEPGAQGRGVGTHILRDLQHLAQRTEKPIRLGVLIENRAQLLYARLGFEAIGRTATHVLMEWRVELGPE